MIGDGLSHVGFAALALATAFNTAPLKVAIPVCIVAAFFLLRISNNGKIRVTRPWHFYAAVPLQWG